MNWPAAFGFSMILGAGVFGWVARWLDGLVDGKGHVIVLGQRNW